MVFNGFELEPEPDTTVTGIINGSLDDVIKKLMEQQP